MRRPRETPGYVACTSSGRWRTYETPSDSDLRRGAAGRVFARAGGGAQHPDRQSGQRGKERRRQGRRQTRRGDERSRDRRAADGTAHDCRARGHQRDPRGERAVHDRGRAGQSARGREREPAAGGVYRHGESDQEDARRRSDARGHDSGGHRAAGRSRNERRLRHQPRRAAGARRAAARGRRPRHAGAAGRDTCLRTRHRGAASGQGEGTRADRDALQRDRYAGSGRT